MCIPSGTAVYTIPFHGFIATENILERTSYYVVNTGHTVGRWRSFVKNKRRSISALTKALGKEVFLFPLS